MTFPLAVGSPRRAAAFRFGAELARLIAKKKIARRELARTAGVGRSALANYLSGQNLPTLQVANRIADILESDSLRQILVESRTYVCPIDGVRFTYNGTSRRRYCSPECRRIAAKQKTGSSSRQRADHAERRLVNVLAAVEAMCRQCEPSGQCRTADCPLRSVSPLPFVVERAS